MNLPDENVTGKAKINKKIFEKKDWKSAKEKNDLSAARRVVDEIWTDKKTENLKAIIGQGNKVALVTIPSTTRTNVIPDALAQKLADGFGDRAKFVDGNKHFDSLHGRQSKNLSQSQKLFDRRKYTFVDEKSFKSEVKGHRIVLVDDVIASGGSISELARTLKSGNIKVHSVAGLMGDRRLKIDDKTLSRMSNALSEKGIDVDIQKLSNTLTRTEAGRVIRMANSVGGEGSREKLELKLKGLTDMERQPIHTGETKNLSESRISHKLEKIGGDHDRNKVTENLQRVLDRADSKDLGRGQEPGRHQSSGATHKGNERVPEGAQVGRSRRSRKDPKGRVGQGEKSSVKTYKIDVIDKDTGQTKSREVSLDTSKFNNQNELRGELDQEAKSFVRRSGMADRDRNIEVIVKPVKTQDNQMAKGLKKVKPSLEKSMSR